MRAFVQRPDGYVFATAESVADLPAVIDELARALGRHGWNAGLADSSATDSSTRSYAVAQQA